jgi:hypothetical protein
MTCLTIFFAALGLLSPANRGALMTAFLLLFSLMGYAMNESMNEWMNE